MQYYVYTLSAIMLLSLPLHGGWWFKNTAQLQQTSDNLSTTAVAGVADSDAQTEEELLKTDLEPAVKRISPQLAERLSTIRKSLHRRQVVGARKNFYIKLKEATTTLPAKLVEHLMVKSIKHQKPEERTFRKAETFYIPVITEPQGEMPADLLQRIEERNKAKKEKVQALQQKDACKKGVAWNILWEAFAKRELSPELQQRLMKKSSYKSTLPMVKGLQESEVASLKAAIKQNKKRLSQLHAMLSSLLNLLKNNPNMRDGYGRSALHHGVLIDYPHIAGLALANGADIDAQDINGNTSLHYAFDLNRLVAATQLIEAGADTTICNFNRETPIDVARAHGILLC